MIKAVIFDLDGTLTDTLESMAIAGNKTLESVGLEPRPIEEYKDFAGDGADTLVKRFLNAAGDVNLEKYAIAYENYMKEFALDCTYNVKVYDGILDMLEKLKVNKIKVAVLSNKPHQRVIEVVYKFFGESMFNIVQGQMEIIPKKPDPTGVINLAKRLGVREDEVLYVGDTDVDMQTGINASMNTAGVLWGFRDEQELRDNGAQYIVSEPAQLLDLIKQF